jgi:hypothetical protein
LVRNVLINFVSSGGLVPTADVNIKIQKITIVKTAVKIIVNVVKNFDTNVMEHYLKHVGLVDN